LRNQSLKKKKVRTYLFNLKLKNKKNVLIKKFEFISNIEDLYKQGKRRLGRDWIGPSAMTKVGTERFMTVQSGPGPFWFRSRL